MTTKRKIARKILRLLEENRQSIALLTGGESKVSRMPHDPLRVGNHIREVIIPNERKIVAKIEEQYGLYDAVELGKIETFLEYTRSQKDWLNTRWPPKYLELPPREFDDLIRDLAK